MSCLDCGKTISKKAVRCRPCADIAKRLVINDDWLERNIIRKDGCWVWQGATNSRGYGIVTNSNQWGEQLVHRLVYLWKIGPISAPTLDHSCYQPLCCNPAHLTPMTRRENSKLSRLVLDQISRTECPHGHRYTPDNTYVSPRDNRRHCRACLRYYNAVARAKKSGLDPTTIRREDFVLPSDPEVVTS